MIIWFTGNTGAGKTTHAKNIISERPKIILDGDDMRETICRDLGLSLTDRFENNLRIARLAVLLESQGFDIVVAVICPTEAMREEVKKITQCHMIYLPYKRDWDVPGSPYERPGAYSVVDERYEERELDKRAPKERI